MADRLALLERSLTNVKPTDGQIGRIEVLREAAMDFAAVLLTTTPESRYQSLAVTALEESVMWAVKSIVLEENK